MASKSSSVVDPLFALACEAPAVQDLRRRVEKGKRVVMEGLSAGAQPFLIGLLAHIYPDRVVVAVAGTVKEQEILQQDVETWLSRDPKGRKARYFPSWEVLPNDTKLPHSDVISERLETLVALSHRDGPAPVVVTSGVALLQRTFSPSSVIARTRLLARGDQVEPLDLVEWLEEQGYEPEAQVNHKGEIALRGGILDIFPLTSPWPVRLEFFGNELESLRYFDPIDQRSKESIERVVLPPAGELSILRRGVDKSADSKATSLIPHLPANALIVLCEPEVIAEQSTHYLSQATTDPLIVSWPEFMKESEATGLVTLELNDSGIPLDNSSADSEAVELKLPGLEAFRPIVDRAPEPQVAEAQRREFFQQLHRWLRQGFAVHVFCNNVGERQRFGEIWDEYGLERTTAPAEPEKARLPGTTRKGAIKLFPVLELGALSRGFLAEESKWVVVTDAEIFGRYRVQRPRRLKSPHAQTSRSLLDVDFTELEEGDFVVHIEHGIGRYVGLQRMPIAGGNKPLEKAAGLVGATQECLVIEYASPDPAQPAPKLYVPVSEAYLVSKYVGAGKANPALNTLGGGRWAKAKEQAAEAVRDLAGEFLAIQAARASQPGHAFPPDVPWQREFESAFLYEETPDQMRAIVETKGDMERAKPMDRLICGDVGYGKTEVAIRAAFKTVMGGKQVAILVPTTILAQQHFNTFRERMADYPIRVELLSRYRTAREQQKVIQETAAGAVDIVIGTHRLTQADVRFKDLGLVVIDEEQRFGVLHKEKFKMLRRLVDVLTLSATPIPRTLYLALTGARDMSTIETPPQDRLPVETIVAEYDERMIRDAIQRELNRGGQVFYLHNRVLDIDQVAARLRDLVPQARMVVGHGQMNADDLEEVMTSFVNGEADVLLSTTIIESGLDIPNANTIIIDRADRFGLSDLYQLRGRVGRYKHQAYAYLLIPRHARMLTDARKRISAIKQYSTLGSGFKIAMRDLEIRGAGNLLGSQQSGHITAVGFDLYCQLLKQSISALKGEKVVSRVDVQVRLDFLALNVAEEGKPGGPGTPWARGRTVAVIPEKYVPDARHRIEVYRKLAEITDREGVEKLRRELADRFGALPISVDLLLQVAELKVVAHERSVSAIETREEKLMLLRGKDYITLGGRFPRLTKKDGKARLKEIRRLLESVH